MDKNEIQIIKTAILNEVEGEKFYRNAAQCATNEDTRNAFRHLADEEKEHHGMLIGMMDKLIAGSEFSIDAARLNQVNSPQIFQNAKTIIDNAMEISVFHIGIMMEKASIDYYRNAAQNTTLQNARSLYDFLANWEVLHLESMEKIYDALTEDWWDKQAFSPS